MKFTPHVFFRTHTLSHRVNPKLMDFFAFAELVEVYLCRVRSLPSKCVKNSEYSINAEDYCKKTSIHYTHSYVMQFDQNNQLVYQFMKYTDEIQTLLK